MRIKQIKLQNFGSYEGINELDLSAENETKRVSIIGGKNGAGKTTLFTAIQVCLYGNYAFGYKLPGKRYLRDIYDLINNNARLDESKTAFIEIAFDQVDNADLVHYEIKRNWDWKNNDISEHVSVMRNDCALAEDELQNFQNYLIHLIPPDMLKLYFFDGEKIADYFLSQKEVNIRDALMILSGNDTFDILYENVKRVLKQSEGNDNTSTDEYLEAKRQQEELAQAASASEKTIGEFQSQREDVAAEIEQHKREYTARGGISLSEWKDLNTQIKAEEEKRERINWQRKETATDILPFIMMPDLVANVLTQLQAEKDHQAYETLKKSLESQDFMAMLNDTIDEIGADNPLLSAEYMYEKIKAFLLDDRWSSFEPLLGLSGDEEGQVQAVISRVNSYEVGELKRYQRRLEASIKKSKQIREKLQKSDVEHFEEYIEELNDLESQLHRLILSEEKETSNFQKLQSASESAQAKVRNLKKHLENQLKKQSVSSVSGKVLLLIEELQEVIYSDLIKQVEDDLNLKFEELIRKEDFFSRITIDRDFTVHILRNQAVTKRELLGLLKNNSLIVMQSILGAHAVQELQEKLNAGTSGELKKKLESDLDKEIVLPVEIDKSYLSSGEKQIFVMALYWALMNQSHNELPFIIDTPFARIDAEHRANITEHFFKKLVGQLVVLSTDEELSGTHLQAMEDQIAHIYLLDYGSDKRTHIQHDLYFEV